MTTREALREAADELGEVLGTSASRLEDGREVAWAVHIDEGRGDDVATVLGESDGKRLLLRIQVGPLAAMAIVRSLVYRAAALEPGQLVWLEPGDVNLAPFLGRPSAYLLVELEGEDTLVAAGVLWSEVALAPDTLRALVVAREGIAPSMMGNLSGVALRDAATSMLATLRRTQDEHAVHVAATGLSYLIERGAAKALVDPLVVVLRDEHAHRAARESAALLLDEADTIRPVLALVREDAMRPVVLPVVKLRIVDKVADLAVTQPLADATRLGLAEGFTLDEARLPELERAIERDPVTWAEWLVERL